MFTREKQEMKRVPMMPVRDMVIFPQQMTPFIVGREASVRALEEALASDRSEEHTSELQSRLHLVCRLLLEKKTNPRRRDLGPRSRAERAGPGGRRPVPPA